MKFNLIKDTEIVCFQLIKCTLQEIMSIHPKADIIFWCDGYVLFLHSIDVAEYSKYLVANNKQLYDEIYYAPCKDKNTKILNASNLQIHVSDHTNNQTLKTIVNYIKKETCH